MLSFSFFCPVPELKNLPNAQAVRNSGAGDRRRERDGADEGAGEEPIGAAVVHVLPRRKAKSI